MLLMFNNIEGDITVMESTDIYAILKTDEIFEGIDSYKIYTNSGSDTTISYSQLIKLKEVLKSNNLMIDCRQ